MVKRISALTAAVLLLIIFITSAAAIQFSDGVYTFERTSSDTAVITGCDLTDSEITVPGFILGYPVTGIGDYAFLRKPGLISVTLPASLYSIGEYAFAENAGLQKVTVPRWCESIADNAFFNSPDVVIYCYTNSAAHTFAADNGVDYVLIDAPPTEPKTNVAEAVVELESYAVRYNGEEQLPAVISVNLGDSILEPESDYTVTYSNNTDAGTATVTITGQGDFEGEAYALFEIKNVLGDVDASGYADVVDATFVQRRATGVSTPYDERAEIVGDVNGDGLDITDSTFIMRYIIRAQVPYPVNEMI